MSDRIDVARVELRDGYTFDGRAERWLSSRDFHIGYEADTDKLVVQRRGSSAIHVIPWSNVVGMELERRQESPREGSNGAGAARSAAGGRSRRDRPPT